MIKNKKYLIEDAINFLKSNSKRKFLETIEISVQFNVIPKNKNFILKGYSLLPNPINKSYKIAIFSDVDCNIDGCMNIDKDLLLSLNKRNIFFDILLVNPKTVVHLGKLSKLLNGRKLMPDLKYGTITDDFQFMVSQIKKNYLQFKSDKNFSFNLLVGRIDLPVPDIIENIAVLLNDIKKQKPTNCKSIYIKQLVVSSTMGPGLLIDIDSLNY